MGIFSKIFGGLKKTKDSISKKISQLFVGELDDDFYEELEYVLISSDIGTQASMKIIDSVKAKAKKLKVKKEDEFKSLLRESMTEILNYDTTISNFPLLITFVGVNGVGKTTSIGKLSNYFQSQGKKTLLVAGDTFRAAASDQLDEWAKRVKTRIVKYGEGTDPGAVVYDGIQSAIAKKDDVVLVDTAGRLHNKTNLMEELGKINKIINREWVAKGYEYKKFLVIDGTTGQNAISQLEAFNDMVGIDGIVLTKLDGTAKGGIVFSISEQFDIPVYFVGVGEQKDDLIPFDANDYIQGII